jgi:acyl-CoA thioesterase I
MRRCSTTMEGPMKRRDIRLVILGLFTFALTLQPTTVGAEAPQRGVYLALGDSLAAGVGATDPTRLGYVPRLFDYFRGIAHFGVDTLTDVGVPGETSTSLLNGGQLTNALAAINDPTTDVRVVTLDIGGNDFAPLIKPGSPCLANPTGVPCQQAIATTLVTFARNYAAILTQLNAALATDPGDETILVMTYYNSLSGTGSPFESIIDAVLLGPDLTVNCATSPTTWGANDIITCVGAQHGAVVADVYPFFQGKASTLTRLTEDQHPNNAGYALIANAFMRASRP